MRSLPMLPSPSRLALAEACAFAWSPLAPEWPEDHGTSARAFGEGISTVAQAAVDGRVVDLAALAAGLGLTPAEATRFERTAEHVAAAVDELRADPAVTELRAEVPVAYSTTMTSARWCAERAPGGRAADEREDERSGAIDLMYRRRGRLFVRDWKSGPRAREHRPRDTVQLLAYGVAAALASGDDEVTIELAHVDEDGVRLVDDDLGPFELDAAALRVAGLYQAVARRDALPSPGSHCWEGYCPVLPVCPVTQQAIEAVHRVAEAPAMVVTFTSPEHAASVRTRAKMVAKALEAIDEALRAYAGHTPIPAGRGKVYGKRVVEREVVDLSAKGAMAVLEQHLGALGVEVAVERSTSGAALHRAAVAVSASGKAAACERALMAALREIGAVRTTQSVRFEEFKPAAPAEETEQ